MISFGTLPELSIYQDDLDEDDAFGQESDPSAIGDSAVPAEDDADAAIPLELRLLSL